MKKTKPMAIVTEDRKRKREGKKERKGGGKEEDRGGGEREREGVGAIDWGDALSFSSSA